MNRGNGFEDEAAANQTSVIGKAPATFYPGNSLRISYCPARLRVLPSSPPVRAQQEVRSPSPTKADLEYQKLQLEVARLQEKEEKESAWLKWLPTLLGFTAAAAGTVGSFLLARRAREGAIDQETHQKRLDRYPDLIKATAPLALYFPEFVYSVRSLDADQRKAIAREMSRWSYEGGGLLLSVTARDAYFRLARELTRASYATELRVRISGRRATLISREDG